MLIFASLAIGGLTLLLGSLVFGHDHDHDFGHDFGHDLAGHDVGHDVDYGSEPTVSIFSTKVIGAFIMAFGAAGAIARFYGWSYLAASLGGLGTGLFFGAMMFLAIDILYKQQIANTVSANDTIGKTGTVTTEIVAMGLGEVELVVKGQSVTCLALSADQKNIPRGKTVRVKDRRGSNLVVEEVV
jgi:membrane-bound ClpP family serine protease